YLNKSDASEGFNQGIDFLNGSYIKYALTVSLTIYVSCIKQFWSTVVIKQSNDVTRIQALVDEKKVLIIEAVTRDALRLDDVEGVDCLPNKEIFAELARDLSTCTTKYISPGLTQKVFENMRKVGKGCSGVKTPLFEGLLVAGEPEEQGDSDEEVQGNDNDAAQGADTAVTEDDVQDQSIPLPTPPTPPPQPPQDIPSTSQLQSPQPQPQSPPPAQPQGADFPISLLQEVLDACATLTRRVEHLKHDKGWMIAVLDRDEGIALMDDEGAEKKVEDAEVADDEQVKGRQADIYEIDMEHVMLSMLKDEPKVQEAVEVVTTAKLITEVVTAAIKVVAASTRRRRKVVIRDAKEESTAKVPGKTKSKDKGKGIMSKEQIKEEENKALECINKTRAQKTARRRKLHEEVKDVKEIKHHLGIVRDEDDVLYTEATPLARKVPVVDYHIIQLNNKHRYKIIRADGTHHLSVHGQAKIKSWKLLESCGVYIISFTTTHLILLVEIRYPLSRFTLDQMLNAVRLQVEEQNEMSLELIRFRRQ
nr:hypothetical protein [Tanacetum cinerariifolium]